MSLLFRINTRSTFGRTSLAHQFTSATAESGIAVTQFFGLVAVVSTGQAVTFDMSVGIKIDAVVTLGQGVGTTDLISLAAGNATVDTSNAASTDATVGIKIDATISTGDARTTDITAGAVAAAAVVDTGQGVSSTNATANLKTNATVSTANAQTDASTVVLPMSVQTAQGATTDAHVSPQINAVVATGQGATTAVAVSFQFTQTLNLTSLGYNAFGGIGFGAGGSGFVAYLNRHLNPSGLVATSYGTANVASSIRDIAPPHYDATTYGTALVALNPRYIQTTFIPATSYGTAIVDQTHFITTTGIADGAFGLQFVHDNRQFPSIQGFTQAAYGTPFVSHNPRIVGPQGFRTVDEFALPSGRWGLPTLINTRQYVTQIFSPALYDGGAFGDYLFMSVLNVDREVGPNGWRDDKFGSGAFIYNNARAIEPLGDDNALFGHHLVAWRNRPLPVPAIDPGQVGEYTVVFNNARVLAPAGITNSIGTPSVVNTRRYYPNITLQDTSEFGVAFIDFAVRTLTAPLGPESFFGTADVELAVRYILPSGMDPYNVAPDYRGQWGLTDLQLHRNIFAPNSVPFDADNQVAAGANVRNRNFTLGMYGLDQSDFGPHTVVKNKIQYAPAGGIDFGEFGGTIVDYRTKHIGVSGFNAGGIGPHSRAAKTTPDPPAAQNIFTTGFGALPIGSPGSDPLVPHPIVHTNVLYPDGWQDDVFGSPRMFQNGIFPIGIFLRIEDQFGTPVFDPTQFIDLGIGNTGTQEGNGIQAPDEADNAGGAINSRKWARLSPYTVYASFDATDQAVQNNGGKRWVFMDGGPTGDDGVRPFFGTQSVTNFRRYVTNLHAHDGAGVPIDQDDVFGASRVSMRIQPVTPDGIKSFKTGYALVNNGFPVEVNGFDMSEFGDASVDHYIDPAIPRLLQPAGMTGGVGPNTHIDLFNRTLPMTGFESLQIRAPHDSSDVEPHRSTRVHFPEPIQPAGITSDLGTAFISYRIRHVQMDGFIAFDDSSGLDEFDERMTVTQRNFLRPSGITAPGFGSAKAELGTRSIAPDPAQRVNPWGNPRVHYQSIVESAGGIGAEQFGDVRKWQDGDPITPDGVDMSLYGTATFARTVPVGGFDASHFGLPAMGGFIRGSGFDASSFGKPTGSYADGDDFVCGQRPRAIPPQGFSGNAFGAQQVTHG